MKFLYNNKIRIGIFTTIISISLVIAIASNAQTLTVKTIAPTKTTAAKISPTNMVSASPGVVPTILLDKDVQMLKDKIATKVAELRKKSKSVVTGIVNTNDNNTITIVSDDAVTHKVAYDETITKLFSLIKKTPQEIKITDIKKGDYLVVSGLQIEDSVTASTIYVDQKYLVLSGKVSDTDKTNFEITVVTTDKETYTLDIESSTKQSIVNSKTGAIDKSGFSKINVGDNIHFVIVKPADSTTNKATVVRLLIIPQEYFVKKQ